MFVPRRWLPILSWPKGMSPILESRDNLKFQRPLTVAVASGRSRMEQDAATKNWLTRIACVSAVLVAIVSVSAEDDPPNTRAPGTRSPNVRTFRPRSPGANSPTTHPPTHRPVAQRRF